MPLVSVIVPVYKTEQYLPKCIDSLLAQTLQELEIILVDDESPDGCGKICDDYAARYPNIRVIHKKNGGPQLARLEGIRVATGKYLGFVDSDDWVMPDMYKPMVEQAEAHGADVVAAGHIRDYETHQEPCENLIPSGVYKEADLCWLWDHAVFNVEKMEQALAPCVWNKILRREKLQETLLNCNEKLAFGEDALHTFAALFSSSCVVIMNEHQQYRYRLRMGSTTNSYYKNYMHDIYVVYDKLHELAQPVKTDALLSNIAYNYVFLYIGGIAQEFGKANPAGLLGKYRNIRAIAKDGRLKKCLPYIDLKRYPRRIALGLRFLSEGRHNSYMLLCLLQKVWDKGKSVLKTCTGKGNEI